MVAEQNIKCFSRLLLENRCVILMNVPQLHAVYVTARACLETEEPFYTNSLCVGLNLSTNRTYFNILVVYNLCLSAVNFKLKTEEF